MAAVRLAFFVAFCTKIFSVQAGNFDADCVGGWTKKTDKLDPNTPSDLSSCQLSSLGFSDANNILLGGEGSSSSIGISLGSGGDGCDGANECMEQCQALCCIADGCIYAEIKRDRDTDCEVSCDIYKEESKYFYCRLYSAGSWRSADSATNCYIGSGQPNNDAECTTIVSTAFGWDQNTYHSLRDCGSRKRALMANGGNLKRPDEAQIKKSVQDGIDKGRTFHQNLLKGIKKVGGAKKFQKKMCNKVCPA